MRTELNIFSEIFEHSYQLSTGTTLCEEIVWSPCTSMLVTYNSLVMILYVISVKNSWHENLDLKTKQKNDFISCVQWDLEGDNIFVVLGNSKKLQIYSNKKTAHYYTGVISQKKHQFAKEFDLYSLCLNKQIELMTIDRSWLVFDDKSNTCHLVIKQYNDENKMIRIPTSFVKFSIQVLNYQIDRVEAVK